MENLILVHSADVCHHGVKGQSWGERKYQYEDGSLTPLGREHYGYGEKEISKAQKKADRLYKKAQRKAESGRKLANRYIDSYNDAANKMNSGLLDKYNKSYEKKLGKNAKNHDYSKDKEYNEGYEKLFGKELTKAYNERLASDVQNSKYYKKAEALVQQYGLKKAKIGY